MPTKRHIRKLTPPSSTALDDRASTVQWVLGVWAALLTVLIVMLGGFDDTRFFYNGWVRLLGMLATWGLLAWAANSKGRRMSQRLRLGAAASLAFHTAVAIALLFAHLTFVFTEPEVDVVRNIVIEPKEVPRLVDVTPPVETEEPAIEKPVPTDQLAQQTQPATSQAKSSPDTPTQESTDPPELASSEAPQSLVQRRPRTALAHRAKSPGERSRQTESAQMASSAPEPLVRPEQMTRPEPTATAATAEPSPAAQVAKAQTTPREQQVIEPQEQLTPSPAQVVERRSSDAPQVAEAVAQRRPVSPAEVVEPAESNLAPRVTTPEINQVAAEPSRVERPRTPMSSPQDVPEPQELRTAPPTAIARRDTREPELPLAATPTPSDRRTPVNVAEAVTTTPEAIQPAETTRTASVTEQSMEPIAAAIGRRELVSPSVAEATETPPDAQAAQAPTPTPTRRRDTAMAATVAQPTEQPSPTPSAAALAESTPTPEPIATIVSRETIGETSSSPAPRVLADSRGGTGLRGEGLNSLNDAPAEPTYSAPFAAASAKRSRSTQTERGPALAPNPVAEVARSRAGASSPMSTLVAQPIPDAVAAGSTTPDDISASSSAAIERQFSNVSMGDVTAARGEAEFDTGPPQITPERGGGRGAQGGRLAMRSPETSRGLGPRQASQAAMAPSAAGVAAAPSPASASPSAGAVAREQLQAGGAPSATIAGRPSEADAPRLTQARVPSGATSGGGASSPSAGPPPSATEVGVIPPRPGGSIARTRDERSRADGPSVAGAPSTPSPRGVAGAASPAAAAAAMVDPVAVALVTPLSSDMIEPSAGAAAPSTSSSADVAPKRETLMPVELGAGGLASEPSFDAGIPQRIARRQANPLRMTPSRFANRSEGGLPTPPGRQRNPAPAFASRADRIDSAPLMSPDDPRPKTEAAIELGLEYLARIQQPDGRWSLTEFSDLPVSEDEVPTIQADGAATGLALLAFLGGGYDHYDDKYQAVIQRGLDYLVAQQSEEGDIFPERNLQGPNATRFYSHGIAALALCEAYGMTGDPELRAPAQAALDYITRTQHPQHHGWRYTVGLNSDLSVTGWQIMAVRSGELAGLEVSQDTYSRVRRFVEECRSTAGGQELYCYNPYVNSNREGMKHYNKPSTVMTSVGMLMQLYLGTNRENRLMQRGADHLSENLPTLTGEYLQAAVGTPGNPQRDTYYWYYATQVMFHMGGEHWQAWHEHLHPLLVDNQTQEGPLAGSWNPQKPVPDMWANQAGRTYVTCLNLLSLEVSYRHLPLYEMTGK
ncbi:hypothetical protein [Aeoliella sp. SH292]|uniref:prenyltransferase/squalene oxidase repeat-containing protein n=1 Tax=Aeoliella sp. SH292 TaxID=3454464 RepID=UPI003F9B1DA7